MKNFQLKIFFTVLISMLVVSTALGKNYFLGKRDIEPGQNGDSKEVVNVAMNVGKIVGIMLLTDENLIKGNNYGLKMGAFSLRNFSKRSNDNMAVIFGFIALILVIINFYFGSKIVEFLKSKGHKANYWAMRWMIFSYVSQYKEITESEGGQPGPYYRPISITALLMLGFLVIAIVFAVL
jgi:hypothetical protein